MKNYKAIAYAIDFVSFLVQELKAETEHIQAIFLFGSAARGEAGAESDIDIFINTKEKGLEDKIERIKDKFYTTIKYKKYWSLLGIQNELSLTVGELEKWEELERSIVAQGMVLYSKYKGKFKGEVYSLFKIEPGKKRADNVRFWRRFYGYTQKVGKKCKIWHSLYYFSSMNSLHTQQQGGACDDCWY